MIKISDLLINSDGSIYHLGLKPNQVAENIIVVGDPDRVELVGSFFDTISHRASNREYKSIIGKFKGKDIMVISSGIGCGAVDILINELDALVNVDFNTREIKTNLTSFNIVRLGTTGAVSDNIELGDFILSRYTIGIDSLALFYKETLDKRELPLERLFVDVAYNDNSLPWPYAIESSKELVSKFKDITVEGITMCAGGFFAPQCRKVRLTPVNSDMIDKLSNLKYNGVGFSNIEMEGAALETLAITLGHKAVTICLAIAHRTKQNVNINYHDRMNDMILSTLERI